MPARDRASGTPGDGHATRPSAARPRGVPGRRAATRAGRARSASEWGRARYRGSWAEHLWRRLDAFDFLNQAILLAATLLLCAVPFMLVTTALAGRSAVAGLTRRLGLSEQAAAAMGDLFASSAATSAAVTGLSWVFFVLGGLAAAGSLQRLYQQMFRLRPQGLRDGLRALAWLGVVVGCAALASVVGHGVYSRAPVLWWIVNVPAFVAFWWFAMWFLLAGRIPWRKLMPCAVATGILWMLMLVVFHFMFSGMVTEYDKKYGPIGVVFALMSFFIAIGVVIILGAATGMMWQERGMSFRAAVTKLKRSS
ncbi:YhjD/YihY/BrkB family envelope integrity protein [Streptomyces sp. NPDC015492]|uniref:YhjD/YihY/BrkB family envelope integrity protein n=1 Tax=Streptomyces sp. NPDC015492 TaxID=3364958 RepID=UPI0036FEFFE8